MTTKEEEQEAEAAAARSKRKKQEAEAAEKGRYNGQQKRRETVSRVRLFQMQAIAVFFTLAVAVLADLPPLELDHSICPSAHASLSSRLQHHANCVCCVSSAFIYICINPQLKQIYLYSHKPAIETDIFIFA